MQEFGRPITENSFLGLNDSEPSHLLSRGFFTKVDNVLVADNVVKKVPGSSTIADAIAVQDINGLASYENSVTASKLIVASVNGAANARLYTWNGSGNFSPIGSANLTNSKVVYFEVANDYLFGFNGTEVVDYEGTTVTKNRATIPLGYFPSWFHNYLFVAKTDTYPHRLFWSDLGNPLVFTSTSFVDINPGDSDQIQGVGTLQDELFVFKRNTVWSITGWAGATFTSTTVNTQNTNARIIGYGCVAPGSIVSAGNDIYFMSFLGSSPVIRSLKKTQFAVTLGGGVITDDIHVTMDTINQNVISKCVGTYDGRYVYFAVPTGASTVNNLVLVLDTWKIVKIKGKTVYSWTTMSQKNIGHIVISTISGKDIPYFSDSNATGKVFKFNSSIHTDDGSAIVMDVRTRDYVLDQTRKSKWKYEYIKAKSGLAGSLVVKARIEQAQDFGVQKTISLEGNSPGLGPTGTFTLGVSVLGGAQITKYRVTFAHLTGTMLGLQYLESTSSDCELYDWEIYGQIKGLRDD